MSTKIDVATFATVLAILAVPSVVSAQHGYANHGLLNSTEATSNLSQPQMNRFKAKVRSNAYGSRDTGLRNLPTDNGIVPAASEAKTSKECTLLFCNFGRGKEERAVLGNC